jgi:hypothetical protein
MLPLREKKQRARKRLPCRIVPDEQSLGGKAACPLSRKRLKPVGSGHIRRVAGSSRTGALGLDRDSRRAHVPVTPHAR